MSILIQAVNASYAYGGNEIFTDITFELKTRERIALIGENGSGKSSLFRLLAKLDTPQTGTVVHKRGLTVGYMEQDVALDPEKTVLETLAASVGTPQALDEELARLEAQMAEPLDDDALAEVIETYTHTLARAEEMAAQSSEDPILDILIGLGVPEAIWEQPCARLSGGERKLVGIATFLTSKPDVLLLDEPENHLDVRARAWLEAFLRDYPGAIGLITHDRYLIDQVATAIVELEDGKLQTWPGTYTQFQAAKRAERERARQIRDMEEREFLKLKKSSEDLTQWARQNPKFASRAENMRRRVAEERARLDANPVPRVERRTINVEFAGERGSTLVLQAEDVAKQYGERTILEPFDLVVRHGERVGIVGPNGAGKTTFMRMVLGEESPDSGRLKVGPSVTPGYFAQQHESLDAKQTPVELVRRLKPLDYQQAVATLALYGFDRDSAETLVGDLSGGERSRLQLASLILTGSNFLLLDEPTNNLDTASVEELEAALLDLEGTILTISHDRYYLNRVCTRIVEFRDGKVLDHSGGYAAYQDTPELGAPLTRSVREQLAAAPVSERKRRRGR